MDIHELKRDVEKWVREFNYINLDTLQAVAEKEGTEIIEYIRQQDITWDDVAEFTGDEKKSLKRKFKTIENHPDYDDIRIQKEQDNYPMWNTLFEFKEEASDEEIQAAIDAGFGVIENFSDFNQILFVAGAGYSFYGAHWIPMYLNLPWNKELKKQFKNTDYSML
jgi:hypothetical protein